MGSVRAYLHPKLDAEKWMIMEIEREHDRLVFEGKLDVEVGLGSAKTEPNGTFHYPNKLPSPEPGDNIPVYASYERKMEGPKLVRISFASDPSEQAEQFGYFESDGPMERLVFISGAKGPGAFLLVPKED
ncbi:hypothetical protein V565_118150 [Rhizoctonia solani 123E]|uniref:Uncharacterized protein n=1 Tax=Rhizoctonia solani 123E TaxID=1423351 RepID=A0A074RVP6_9AGAM|nr:hypothetical protein V565_118150 [Rhizoctonia solani 123E]